MIAGVVRGLYGCYCVERHSFGPNDEEMWENQPTIKLFPDVARGDTAEEVEQNLRDFLEKHKESPAYMGQEILQCRLKTASSLYRAGGHSVWRHFEIALVEARDLAPTVSAQVNPELLMGYTGEI